MRQTLNEAKESWIGTVLVPLMMVIVTLFILGIVAFTIMYFKDPKNPWLGGSFLDLAQVWRYSRYLDGPEDSLE